MQLVYLMSRLSSCHDTDDNDGAPPPKVIIPVPLTSTAPFPFSLPFLPFIPLGSNSFLLWLAQKCFKLLMNFDSTFLGFLIGP